MRGTEKKHKSLPWFIIIKLWNEFLQSIPALADWSSMDDQMH